MTDSIDSITAELSDNLTDLNKCVVGLQKDLNASKKRLQSTVDDIRIVFEGLSGQQKAAGGKVDKSGGMTRDEQIEKLADFLSDPVGTGVPGSGLESCIAA